MMKSLESLSQVAEFHKTFQHPIEPEPCVPSRERCDLRISLLQEELDELKEAIDKQDIIEIADALCDIQYVLSGAVLEFGLGNRFRELFDEVQRSNMSKACRTENEAKATVAHYANQGTSCYYKEKEGKFMVYRKGDNKTLKSIGYSPADLNSIINSKNNGLADNTGSK